MDKHPLDRIFEQKLGKHASSPRMQAWEKLAQQLPAQQPAKPEGRAIWAWIAAACCLLGLSLGPLSPSQAPELAHPLHVAAWAEQEMPSLVAERPSEVEEVAEVAVVQPLQTDELQLPEIASADTAKPTGQSLLVEKVLTQADLLALEASDSATEAVSAPVRVLVKLNLGNAQGAVEQPATVAEGPGKAMPGKLLVTLKRHKHVERELAPGDTLYQGFWANVAYLLQPRK